MQQASLKLQATAGKLKSLGVKRAVKLCERKKFGKKPQYYKANIKLDGHDRS